MAILKKLGVVVVEQASSLALSLVARGAGRSKRGRLLYLRPI